MSRRQGRISNRGNAKVGAGGRQRGYRKAGSKRSECIGSPGKQNTGEMLRMSAGAKQDFAVSARKCAAYMCVCEWGAGVVKQSGLMSDWWQLYDWCNGGWECVCRSAVNDGSCSPWVMCSCSVVSGNQIHDTSSEAVICGLTYFVVYFQQFQYEKLLLYWFNRFIAFKKKSWIYCILGGEKYQFYIINIWKSGLDFFMLL